MQIVLSMICRSYGLGLAPTHSPLPLWGKPYATNPHLRFRVFITTQDTVDQYKNADRLGDIPTREFAFLKQIIVGVQYQRCN
jgi:hypothetical protein